MVAQRQGLQVLADLIDTHKVAEYSIPVRATGMPAGGLVGQGQLALSLKRWAVTFSAARRKDRHGPDLSPAAVCRAGYSLL